MTVHKTKLDTLRAEVDGILSHTFTSSFWKLAALCSIIGLYFILVNCLQQYFSLSIKKSYLWATILWFSFTIVFLAVICIHAYVKLRSKIISLNIDEFNTQEYLFKLGSQYTGRAYKFTKVSYQIKSNGAAYKKQHFNLCAVGEHILSMDYFSKTPHVLNSEKFTCHTIMAEAKDQDKVKIQPAEVQSSANECIWELLFMPRLNRGDSIEYYFEHELPVGTYAMNKDDLKKRELEYEYYAHEIRHPTEEFSINLLFPKNFSPILLQYDVWIGEANYRHNSEYYRVGLEDYFKSSVKEDGVTFAELVVPYPIHGLTYVIRWVPPI
jgi:hypothetical protein